MRRLRLPKINRQHKILIERKRADKTVIVKRYPIVHDRVVIKQGGLKGRGDIAYKPYLDPERVVSKGIFRTPKAYYTDGAKELTDTRLHGDPPQVDADALLHAVEVQLLAQQAKLAKKEFPLALLNIIISVIIIAILVM